MEWLYLIIAGICELVWAFELEASHSFTILLPSVIAIGFIIVSFFLFAKAMQKIAIGTAYAIFTGIGAAGTAIVGIVLLNESVSIWKILALVCLLAGIIGLKLSDNPKKEEAEQV
ncbi:DMT family transporter [Culicoidibacter larvae]|uniref:Multidrug efflux SMR transporter n=1 Tax=Culicoidibacter larvae TaxID=2579976 RepID=A0A5R8QH19_9FIRM|nr:multidrug efflux SMR transporter [Culicoidibacter larvae]TLG77315.1 multidrug efflux SMR transporter [Culicoidibacter larvae]